MSSRIRAILEGWEKRITMQLAFPELAPQFRVEKFSTQLLKWIGNKQRFAHEIASYFPAQYGTYFEPFLGSGAVLGTLAPSRAVGGDVFLPLIEIWQTLHRDPVLLSEWYRERYSLCAEVGKIEGYEQIKSSYNRSPNGADLLFLSRACYGGVVRFRKSDGYMSTPCGVHDPVHPESFERRVAIWNMRTAGAEFVNADFEDLLGAAQGGDLVYCDPPYVDSQAILYGAQEFSLSRLFNAIDRAKARGVYVALSIDGTKKSGDRSVSLDWPDGLFEVEAFVNCGRSMLRRFQRGGETLEDEVVADRLLLTYQP